METYLVSLNAYELSHLSKCAALKERRKMKTNVRQVRMYLLLHHPSEPIAGKERRKLENGVGELKAY